MSGARGRKRLLPYVFTLALMLALMAAPQFLRLPIPDSAASATTARLSLNGGAEEVVELPQRWPRSLGATSVHAVYRLQIDLPAAEVSYLLIPAAQHEMSIRLDGQRLPNADVHTIGEPSVGAPYLLQLPRGATGPTELEITLTRRNGVIPGYLSAVHAADEEAIASMRWIWAFVTGGGRAAIVVLQALVIVGIATVWIARRQDPIFAWLFLIGAGSLAYSLANSRAEMFTSADGQPFLVFTMSSFGLMAVGLAQAIIGLHRPAWLKAAIVALPLALIVAAEWRLVPPILCILISSLAAIGGHMVAAFLLARDALRRDEWDRALLAVPFFLVAWYGLRDIGIVTGLVDGALLLSPKIRLVTIVAVLTLLMRRLASSLDALDRSNETLRLKLAAQEEQLSVLHAKEKDLTAQTTREQERGRLMRDLHDGLSGHLVSIIALSQEQGADPKSIERAARGALDDLRLVINSLDLEDGDLLLALAGLRERLEPQLRRLGVELRWSMDQLPQVNGISPSNALSILRILQEAITNALKHGGGDAIAVKGSEGGDGVVILQVTNDIRPGAAPGQGHGLRNMRRRAAELGGTVGFDIADGKAVLAVTLPAVLTSES